MRICVVGLWHLGTVTAACLATFGHTVVGFDFDTETVQKLQGARPPLFETGLEDLVRSGLASTRLRFTNSVADALSDAEVVWVTYDTPVDDDDQADVPFVFERVKQLFAHLAEETLVLISSQVPVGTTRRLEQAYATCYPNGAVTFGYLPENLRLGTAISTFMRPDRVLAGVRTKLDRERVAALLSPFADRIEWMSVESAEMAKHALNAFLATSIAFINEVATLCEEVGADALEVERALRSDARIGPQAYLSPGSAFAGGTLARDLSYLAQIGAACSHPVFLLSAVRKSNDAHKLWVCLRLQAILGDLRGQRVAVWGLTYKPGTDSLRRSSSVELCRWLTHQGAQVRAHDPAIQELPEHLAKEFALCSSALLALDAATALVVATGWPDYRLLSPEAVLAAMRVPLVLDPNRFLCSTLGSDPRIRYVSVGRGNYDARLP